MTIPLSEQSEDWIDLFDLDAIPEPFDKHQECHFFFNLIEKETDLKRFRWIASAFLSAAYSFFEISALCAYTKFSNPDTGEPIPNEVALEVLSPYIEITQNKKRLNYIKTAGLHPIVKDLYHRRKRNTHYSPLHILKSGINLPTDFQMGYLIGKGVPAVEFCRQVITLIDDVADKLQEEI